MGYSSCTEARENRVLVLLAEEKKEKKKGRLLSTRLTNQNNLPLATALSHSIHSNSRTRSSSHTQATHVRAAIAHTHNSRSRQISHLSPSTLKPLLPSRFLTVQPSSDEAKTTWRMVRVLSRLSRPLLTETVNMTDDSILGASEGAFDLTQPSSVGEVDAWIENLMACKQLSEVDVKKLCDKVCISSSSRTTRNKCLGCLTDTVRLARYSRTSRMCKLCTLLSPSVETSTVNSTIFKNSLRLEESHPTRTTCLWEIMSTEVITLWKL